MNILIPEGLARCAVCGEYKGEITEYGQRVIVDCICNGIFCPKCKINKVRKPISNFWDEKTQRILHIPWFAITKCKSCLKEENHE